MKEETSAREINKVKRGEVYAVGWAESRMDTHLSFHWIWEQLGGYQYSTFILEPKQSLVCSPSSSTHKEKELLTEEQVVAGYDWIL